MLSQVSKRAHAQFVCMTSLFSGPLMQNTFLRPCIMPLYSVVDEPTTLLACIYTPFHQSDGHLTPCLYATFAAIKNKRNSIVERTREEIIVAQTNAIGEKVHRRIISILGAIFIGHSKPKL